MAGGDTAKARHQAIVLPSHCHGASRAALHDCMGIGAALQTASVACRYAAVRVGECLNE